MITFCNFATKIAKMMNLFLLIILLALPSLNGTAQQPAQASSSKNAFEIISRKDNAKGGSVVFHQDKRIERLVAENSANPGAPPLGFRVQVFSSNVHRTAKDEAFTLERQLSEAFPGTGIYVSYSSPFWKVRVGDFLTQEEARLFSEQLLSKFPKLRGTTYTVRDRVSSKVNK